MCSISRVDIHYTLHGNLLLNMLGALRPIFMITQIPSIVKTRTGHSNITLKIQNKITFFAIKGRKFSVITVVKVSLYWV
jgi:hypothetical protein